MKRFTAISLLFLISLSVIAQKANILVIPAKNQGLSNWEILDNQNQVVFSGSEYLQNDSVSFSLDPDNLYFLKVTLTGITNPDLVLLQLWLNNEPILSVKSDIGSGERLFPFFTGVRKIGGKITGGVNALISDFPWQVYYISGNFRCGGTIISNRWVVTAAHCTKNSTGQAILASDMFVKVGADTDPEHTTGGRYAVSEAIVNEGYNDQTLLNDIALLRLTDTINFANARPIKLISADDVARGAIAPGVVTWVSGWGYTQVNPNVIPLVLQKVQLPIVSTATASSVWGSIPATDLMAGFLNGNKDACNGDSGGPMVVPVLDEFKLAGIVSWGSSNCNTYGAYTRVSDFLTWIRSKTGIVADFTPPAPRGDSIICHGTLSTPYSVPAVTGATAYEWKLLPTSAGTISGNGQNASVTWNQGYLGRVNVIMRVTISGKVSDWGRLDGNVVLNTRLISQSRDTILCAGHPVTLSVNTEGYNLRFSWLKNGQAVQTGTSPKLIFATTTADNSGDYRCTITGSCGTITSNTIKLTVYPITHVLSIPPATEVPFGNDVTLKVNAEGHDLVYQWLKDGQPIANSNTAGLFLQKLDANDIGIYRVKVSGSCGVETSDTIYLYVKRTNLSSDPQVFVWPSVTSDEFSVALSDDSFYNIQIFNTSGKKMKEQLNCRYQTRFNIGTMAKGVYIVLVYNPDFRKSVKIIKE